MFRIVLLPWDDIGNRSWSLRTSITLSIIIFISHNISKFTSLPIVCDGELFKRWAQSMLGQFSFYIWIEVLFLLGRFKECFNDFDPVNLHMYHTLRLFWAQLMLLNGLDDFVDACRSFLRRIIYETTFRNAMQAPHNRGLNKAHWSVNIVILDSRYQNLLTFLQ